MAVRGDETKYRAHGYIFALRVCRYAICAKIVFVGLTFAQTAAVDTVANGHISDNTYEIAGVADTASKKRNNDITDTIHYESDFVDYDNEEKILSLHGNASVKYQNITLTADTIVYTVSSDMFHARGTPMLIDGGDTTVGDFMVYNIKTRRGRVSYAVTRIDETYVTGSNIVKTPENSLYIEQGDYTSCQNPEHPHYYFYGRHIKVIPDDKIISRPVILNVADAPIAVLPYFVIPLQKGRRSGWLAPSWGGSVARGGYVDNLGYYFAPNDYYDITLSAKAQEFNSFVLNAGGRYNLLYMLDGSVSGRYVADNRLESSSRQWALDYKHNQFLTPDGKTRLSGSGSILSNRTFNQLYSDNTYQLEQQQLDANMSLEHRIESINALIGLTWRRNHNLTTDRIIEDMPSLNFNLQNRAFIPYKSDDSKSEPSWYNNIYYSYNTKAIMRRDVYGNDSLPGFIRPGMEHNVKLNSSHKILKYVDVTPFFNTRASLFYGAIDTLVKDTVYVTDTLVYQVKDPQKDTRAPDYTLLSAIPEYFINESGDLDTLYTVVKISPARQHLVRDTLPNEFNIVRSWNAGVNMSTQIYGLFPVGAFGVTAIRHTLTPTVGYSFEPKHELDRMFYNVGINYDRARPKAQQLINFTLSNRFQGKRVVKAGSKKGDDNRRGRMGASSAVTEAAARAADGISAIEEKTGAAEENNKTEEIANGDESVSQCEGDDCLSVTDSLAADGAHEANGKNAAGDTLSIGDKSESNNTAAKREEKFDIVTFSMGTSYDFEADARRWRDLSISASTSAKMLNLTFSSAFWFYDEFDKLNALPVLRNYGVDLTSRSLGVTGKFWDGSLLDMDVIKPNEPQQLNGKTNLQNWSINFAPSFSYRANRETTRDRFLPVKSFNLSSSANLHLTRSMSVSWNGNYDFSSNQFSHNNFNFYYDLECWEMRFTWRPEKINPGFHFVVNIKKIPDIKWEEKESKTTRAL